MASFLKKNSALFYSLLITTIICLSGVWSFLNLRVSENLEASFPKPKSLQKIDPVIQRAKNTVVFSISSAQKLHANNDLQQLADSTINVLTKNSSNLLGNFSYKIDTDPEFFINYIYNNAYLFIDSADYAQIAKAIMHDSIESKMYNNLTTLTSYDGFAKKDLILKDPLGLTSFAWRKIKTDYDLEDNIKNNGYYLNKEGNQLLITAELQYNSASSAKNKQLATALDSTIQTFNANTSHFELDYFGTFLIANANANQISEDISLTITLAVVCILALLFYYFRNPIILSLFLLPGAVGICFSALCIWLYQGEISGIALSAGAIVMGIVVDYSFHFFSDFKQTKDALLTKKQLMLPLLVSGATTIIAFISLMFANSKVLHDFGLFTSTSLIGALLFVLFVLPTSLNAVKQRLNFNATNRFDNWVASVNLEKYTNSSIFFILIISATVFLGYFANDVTFSTNIDHINFHPKQLKEKEIKHQNIDPETQKRIQFYVHGSTPNQLAEKNFNLYQSLQSNRVEFEINQINGLGRFFVPDTEKTKKYNQWLNFWAANGKSTINSINQSSAKLGFQPNAFTGFEQWISNNEAPKSNWQELAQNPLFANYLITEENEYGALTSVVLSKNKMTLLNEKSENWDAFVIDGASIMEKLVSMVKDDFNYLLLFVTVLVIIALLLIYGSIELTLISFAPMAISWIWILGIAALLNIEFNFVNIVLVTFIFGLGDDFAIFITDGMLTKYKYGKKVLGHYKSGILLSSISTIIGTGVLFFAKHPAIKSIAAISVLGIVIIVFVSNFVQPILFNFLITRRLKQNKPPVTFLDIAMSILGYTIFIVGSLVAASLGFIIRYLTFKPVNHKKHLVRKVLQKVSGFMLDVLVTTRKRNHQFENLDFSKPSVIIANHASFFDILAIARLSPNLVMFVNNWVYNSPLFGSAIRFADYIPVMDDMETNQKRCKELIDKGISIMIFPEGKRSENGKLNRFHKGAFKLAIDLNVDITPIILHGYGYVMPKYDYNLKSSHLNTIVLPRISNSDKSFGTGYKERTKAISAHYKKQFAIETNKLEKTDFHWFALSRMYKYKGPVLEWYFQIKWKFEKDNYEFYHQLIKNNSTKVYDLGCGYGYISHYLKLRNTNYNIHAFDFDEDKVAVAQNSYLTTEGITFNTSDIKRIYPENADAIIIADTLHYLPYADQVSVLNNCLNGLNVNGKLLIRDGLSDDKTTHAWTEKSEKWSTQIMKFNKVSGHLHFMNRKFFTDWAANNNLKLTFHTQSKTSSNMLIELEKCT